LPSGGSRSGLAALLVHLPLAAAALAALAAAVAGALELVWHARVFAGRAAFPLDLEWLEGGMLVHAQRLAAGQPLYVPPSVDFIPYLYTPLYPALLAALGKIFPFGYLLGRVVSLVAFAGALALLALAAAREGAARPGQESPPLSPPRLLAAAVAVAGAGAIAASFQFTGAFYDLVRADSILLALEAAALVLALWGRSLASAAAAGVVMALAFLTKQTGPVVGVGIGLGLLLVSWRRALVYGAVAGVLMSLGLLYLVKSSHGWFWTYIFKLHQSHPFRSDTLTTSSPFMLRYCWATVLALGLATLGLAIGGRLRRSDAILWGAAVGGFASGVLGFATMWAFPNAFIPAIYFPAFAAAVLTARLLVYGVWSRAPGALLAGIACTLALGLQNARVGKPSFALLVPRPADRAAAARFLEKLRSLPGDGFIPFHPFYGALAGKRTFVHRMGVMDVGAALGRPAGLVEAIGGRRFAWIVLDWKSQPGEWPLLESSYRVDHEFQEGVDAVRSFSGAETSPRWLLVPARERPALPPGGTRITDFEALNWQGWVTEGAAFGPAPAPASENLFGRYAADSARFGVAAQGSVRSPPIRLGRPHFRFTVSLIGPPDSKVRVLLLAGGRTVRSISPSPGTSPVEWDVGDLVGRDVVFLVEDRSPTSGIAVDELMGY
jgi:hypothetical protein